MTVPATADRAPGGPGGRALLIGAVLAYRFALDAAYFLFIQPRFHHFGFVLDVDWLKVAESWVLLALVAALTSLACSKRRPTDILVLLLLAVPIVPVLSLYGLRDEPRAATYIMIGSYLALLAGRLVPFPRLPRPRRGVTVALAVCATGVAASIAWIIFRGGLATFTLDLSAVYYFREMAAEAFSVGVWPYVITWSFKVFTLALLGWALYRRRWAWVAAALAAQVMLFGLTSHRSALFYPVLVLGLYALDRLRVPDHGAIWAAAAAVAAGVAAYVVAGEAIWPSLLIRRVIFVPALLDYAYYDFFGRFGHVMMSNGLLGRFFDYPFDLAPPHLIARYLYDSTDMSANTGLIATGFMHFGAWGALAFGAIAGWLLSITDSLTTGRLPRWLALSAVVAPFFSAFSSSDLPTSILTHGIAVGLVVTWLLSSAEESASVGGPATARPPTDPARLERILDRLGLGVALLAIAAISGRLVFGIDPLAESAFAAMVRLFASGGMPGVDEIAGGQSAALLFVPVVSAWRAATGGTEGIVLLLRGAYLALALGAFAACTAALRRRAPWWLALPAAACSVTLVGSVAQTGGVRAGGLSLIAAIALALLALDPGMAPRRATLFAAGAGIAAGLAAGVDAGMRLPAICAALFFLRLTDASTRTRLYAFVAGAVAGAAPFAIVSLLAGSSTAAEAAAYAEALHAPLAEPASAAVARQVVAFLSSRWPVLAAAGFAWFAHARGRRVGPWLTATTIAAFLPWGDGLARVLPNVALTVLLLGGAAWLAERRKPAALGSLALWGLGLPAVAVIGTLSASPGPPSLPAAGAAAALCLPFAVVILARVPGASADHAEARTIAAFALAAVACLAGVFHQYAYVPNDARVSAQVSTIASGPYRGLRTTAERAAVLGSLQEELERPSASAGPIVAFDRFPAAYLLSPAPAAGPSVCYEGNLPGDTSGLTAPEAWYAARGVRPAIAVLRLGETLGPEPGTYGPHHPLGEYVRSRTETTLVETEDYRVVRLRP